MNDLTRQPPANTLPLDGYLMDNYYGFRDSESFIFRQRCRYEIYPDASKARINEEPSVAAPQGKP